MRRGAARAGRPSSRPANDPRHPAPSPLQVRVLIVGAGPTGLGAAHRLAQHGVQDWLLVDAVRSG